MVVDLERVKESIFLKNGEELVEAVDCVFNADDLKGTFGDYPKGVLVLTNNRLIFAQITGLLRKTSKVLINQEYRNLLGVSRGGVLFGKHVLVSVEKDQSTKTLKFSCIPDIDRVIEKIAELKNSHVEEKTIVAQKVIIEEKEKENAMQILQKKLARGEITVEEFHKRVQRL